MPTPETGRSETSHRGKAGVAEFMQDTQIPGWPWRAGCRWFAYLLLWLLTAAACILSSYHTALQVAGVFLGCLLAASLPLLAATLFEVAFSRRARTDIPLLCCPWLGGVVALLGSIALLQASPLISWEISAVQVTSAHELCHRYAGKVLEALPRTVCMQEAFIKTEWEAGRLRCQDQEDHVECLPEFTAAPIFNSKGAADNGLPESIWAWAVSKGRHVDTNYRHDGSLCGFLSGHSDFDFFYQDYRLAVERVIDKHKLTFSMKEEEGAPALPADVDVPLTSRPLLFSVDPGEASSRKEGWLLAAVLLLCFCPCTGPIPLATMLLYLCWTRNDKYARVPQEDEEVEAFFNADWG